MESEIYNLLKLFGLDKTDCRIYYCIVNTGTISASMLSSKLQIERNKVYRSLTKLKNQGLIESTFSNPVLYKTDSIHNGLSTIIKRRSDELQNLEKISSILKDKLDRVSHPTLQEKRSSMSIIQGRENIYSKIGKIFGESKNKIYFCAPPTDLLNMYHTVIPEKIQIAKKNGVEVKIITEFYDEPTDKIIQKINPTEIRYAKIPSKSRILVEEKKQIVMSDTIVDNMSLNELNDVIFHSTSDAITESITMLCENLWKSAKNDPLKSNTEKRKAVTAIVVDDDINNVTILSDLVKVIGLDVVAQGFDGNEAANLYKSLKPDLVFTDIMMPVADGFVGIEKIKEFNPNAKIIAVTADLTQDVSDRLSTLDVSAIIYKPYSIKEIKEALIEKYNIQI